MEIRADVAPEWLEEDEMAATGMAWVRSGRTVALRVPSAVVRGDWNVLLNPGHKEFGRVEVVESVAFWYDERMFR